MNYDEWVEQQPIEQQEAMDNHFEQMNEQVAEGDSYASQY